MVDFSALNKALEARRQSGKYLGLPQSGHSDRSDVLWHEGDGPVTKVNGPLPTEVAEMLGVPPVRGYTVKEAATWDPPKPEAPPAPVPEVQLSAEQRAALKTMADPTHNIILTGAAGAGKSTVVKEFVRLHGGLVCSTTAKSALLVGGVTVDKIFAFSRESWKVWGWPYLEKLMPGLPRTIIVDEAGAAGANMCRILLDVAKAFNKRLILVGDWAQTAPVKDDWSISSELFLTAKFIKLTECHRQSDAKFLSALNFLRYGVCNDVVREVFKPCIVDSPPVDDAYLRLFATNRLKDEFNTQRLESTNGARVTLTSYVTDKRSSREKPMTDDDKERILDDSRFAHREPFRCGARVMFRMNEPGDFATYVNGDMGTLVDVIAKDGRALSGAPDHNPWKPAVMEPDDVDHLLVHRDRGDTTIAIRRLEFVVKTVFNNPDYAITGFPISLGWATTIHSAQGLTLDKAFLDMASIGRMQGESKHGLAYVALSRTRTLQGLQIANWTDASVYSCDKVRNFI